MTLPTTSTRLPPRPAWSLERLRHERAIAIGCSIEPSTAAAYASALNSYISFCNIHNLPCTPCPDTISFYVVFMCHHIKPQSVDNYLSGICNQLEPYFPDIRSIRRHHLVTKTLAGCKKMCAVGTTRRRPLSRDDLINIVSTCLTSGSHDDLTFATIATTAFHALLRLGELTWPDSLPLQDYRKVVLRDSVLVHPNCFEFFLPGHKADRFFEGNRVLVHATATRDNPVSTFRRYLSS